LGFHKEADATARGLVLAGVTQAAVTFTRAILGMMIDMMMTTTESAKAFTMIRIIIQTMTALIIARAVIAVTLVAEIVAVVANKNVHRT
jgi:hypothetical protein